MSTHTQANNFHVVSVVVEEPLLPSTCFTAPPTHVDASGLLFFVHPDGQGNSLVLNRTSGQQDVKGDGDPRFSETELKQYFPSLKKIGS